MNTHLYKIVAWKENNGFSRKSRTVWQLQKHIAFKVKIQEYIDKVQIWHIDHKDMLSN
jgi:hypothetical protein